MAADQWKHRIIDGVYCKCWTFLSIYPWIWLDWMLVNHELRFESISPVSKSLYRIYIHSENIAEFRFDRSNYCWRDLARRNTVVMRLDFYQCSVAPCKPGNYSNFPLTLCAQCKQHENDDNPHSAPEKYSRHRYLVCVYVRVHELVVNAYVPCPGRNTHTAIYANNIFLGWAPNQIYWHERWFQTSISLIVQFIPQLATHGWPTSITYWWRGHCCRPYTCVHYEYILFFWSSVCQRNNIISLSCGVHYVVHQLPSQIFVFLNQ